LDGEFDLTLPLCENTTFIEISDGQHYLTVYSNDTANNTASSTVYFTVDTEYPALVVLSPENMTYNSSSVGLEYSASDASSVPSCGYYLDGVFRGALAQCENTLLSGLANGAHNVTVYVNDSAGHEISSTVYFSINSTEDDGGDEGGDEPDYECMTSSGCGECEMCSNHECIVPDGSCASPSDCSGESRFYKCEECSCIGYECEADSDCSESELCDGGECVPYSVVPVNATCIGDANCTGTDICEEGACVSAECLLDMDCRNGFLCEAYRCVPQSCLTDAFCAEGFICEAGICVPEECAYNMDCGSGEVCRSHRCFRGCASDEGCTEGFICIEGACVVEECTTDEDCLGGALCKRHRCMAPGACVMDIDCGNDEVCRNGGCAKRESNEPAIPPERPEKPGHEPEEPGFFPVLPELPLVSPISNETWNISYALPLLEWDTTVETITGVQMDEQTKTYAGASFLLILAGLLYFLYMQRIRALRAPPKAN
jgi:Cys-rich repeat protein